MLPLLRTLRLLPTIAYMKTRRINGDAVRAFREIRGLSSRSLAIAVGVNVSTISRVEDGSRQLSPEKVQLLADTLQVNTYAVTYPLFAHATEAA